MILKKNNHQFVNYRLLYILEITFIEIAVSNRDLFGIKSKKLYLSQRKHLLK